MSQDQALAMQEEATNWPRLIDYFLVFGSQNQGEELIPLARHGRSNSQTIRPVSGLCIVHHVDDIPPEYQMVTDMDGHACNLSSGFMRNTVYLCESRLPAERRGSTVMMPITDVAVFLGEKGQQRPPQCYEQCQGFLGMAMSAKKGMSLRGRGSVHVERDLLKDPIIDVKIIDTNTTQCPVGWRLVDKCLNAGGGIKKMSGKLGSMAKAAGGSMAKFTRGKLKGRMDTLGARKRPKYHIIFRTAVRKVREAQSYTPLVTDRLPETDHADFECESEGIALLCFPRGLILQEKPKLPTFLTFVLTQADGREIHGAALTFFEELNSKCPTVDAPTPRFLPKCMCILSHFPYYTAFRTILNQLYRVGVSPSPLPLERYIAHLMNDVPAPCTAYPRVQYQIGHETVVFSRPPRMALPQTDMSLFPLFQCLSLPNIVSVFEHVLNEGKTVLISQSFEMLNPVAEAVRELLFPLKWQNVFIPILPSSLAYTVRAPVPFFVGVHRSFLDEIEVGPDVLIVDLDRNSLRMPRFGGGGGEEDDTGPPPTPLPQQLRAKLLRELSPFEHLYQGKDTSAEELSAFVQTGEGGSEDLEEDVVKVAFMHTLIVFLAPYRAHVQLREDTPDNLFDLTCMFDMKGYAQGFSPELRPFAEHFSQTQLFADFVLNRVSLTPKMEQMLFFDWCIALARGPSPGAQIPLKSRALLAEVRRLAGRAPAPLLFPPRVTSDLRQPAHPFVTDQGVYVCPPPSDEGVGKGPFAIDIFPKFNPRLYGPPHPQSLHLNPAPRPERAADFVAEDLSALCMSYVRALYDVLPVVVNGPLAPEVLREKAKDSVRSVYTLWFLLFTQQRRQGLRQRDGLCWPDPTLPRELALEKAIEARAQRTRAALTDLVCMLRTVHSMCAQAAVAPKDQVLLAVCRFCAQEGLAEQMQVFWRLLATAIPAPKPAIFQLLARSGHEQRADEQQEQKRQQLRPAKFQLPDCVETECVCSTCGYALSGAEIVGGWLSEGPDGNSGKSAENRGSSKSVDGSSIHSSGGGGGGGGDNSNSNSSSSSSSSSSSTSSSKRHQPTFCPMCENVVKPSLVVSHGQRQTKVIFIKPDALISNIQQHNSASGKSSEPASQLRTVRETEHLFWNCFFNFASRASGSPREGGLPWGFLFDNERRDGATHEEEAPPLAQYQVFTGAHKPWIITRMDGSQAAAASNGLRQQQQQADGPSASATPLKEGQAVEFEYQAGEGKLRAKVVYTMTNVKNQKVQRALRAFLTGRRQLVQSKAVRAGGIKDIDFEFFHGSAFRQLALLYPPQGLGAGGRGSILLGGGGGAAAADPSTPSKPSGPLEPAVHLREFAQQYRAAIAWLDKGIADQRRSLEELSSQPAPEHEEEKVQREAQKVALSTALHEWIALRKEVGVWDNCPGERYIQAACAVLAVYGAFERPDGHKARQSPVAGVARRLSLGSTRKKKKKTKGDEAVRVPGLRAVLQWDDRHAAAADLSQHGFLAYTEHVRDPEAVKGLEVPQSVAQYAYWMARLWLAAEAWAVVARAPTREPSLASLSEKNRAAAVAERAEALYDQFLSGTLTRAAVSSEEEHNKRAPKLPGLSNEVLRALQEALGREVERELLDPLLGTSLGRQTLRDVPAEAFDAVQDAAFMWMQEHAHPFWPNYVKWNRARLAAQKQQAAAGKEAQAAQAELAAIQEVADKQQQQQLHPKEQAQGDEQRSRREEERAADEAAFEELFASNVQVSDPGGDEGGDDDDIFG